MGKNHSAFAASCVLSTAELSLMKNWPRLEEAEQRWGEMVVWKTTDPRVCWNIETAEVGGSLKESVWINELLAGCFQGNKGKGGNFSVLDQCAEMSCTELKAGSSVATQPGWGEQGHCSAQKLNFMGKKTSGAIQSSGSCPCPTVLPSEITPCRAPHPSGWAVAITQKQTPVTPAKASSESTEEILPWCFWTMGTVLSLVSEVLGHPPSSDSPEGFCSQWAIPPAIPAGMIPPQSLKPPWDGWDEEALRLVNLRCEENSISPCSDGRGGKWGAFPGAGVTQQQSCASLHLCSNWRAVSLSLPWFMLCYKALQGPQLNHQLNKVMLGA